MPRPLDTPTVEMPASGSFNRFIPRKELSKKLGECPRSTKRRQDTDPDFPPTYYFNGRAHHTDADVENYVQVLMRRGVRAGTYPANTAPEKCKPSKATA